MMSETATDSRPDSNRFLEKLAAQRAHLSPSERRVADFVLDRPEQVIRMSIATLAETVGVSQPTVLRFVRALGLQRYPELKLLTGQSIVSGTPYLHSEVAPDDDLDAIVTKVFDSSVYVLNAVRQSIDRDALKRVVDLLHKARRIDCFGTGAASILAIEAQHKLMRLGIPVVTYGDTHLQRMAAATLHPGDVALCFSHTGEVGDTVKMAQMARQVGAAVIAVTRPETTLAKAADVLLAVDAQENTEVYAPMTSRVAHAVLIDVIATALALSFGEPMLARLREVKDSLTDLRLQPHRGEASLPRRDRP
jgi:RpiR family carbohydrate utilization transcriptional regulator